MVEGGVCLRDREGGVRSGALPDQMHCQVQLPVLVCEDSVEI